MTHPSDPREPTDGYLDEEFARFRAERLAARQKTDSAPPEGAPAPEEKAEEPTDGYLDDDFARFRAERLKNTPPRATARLRPEPEGKKQEKPEGEDGLFFGTNSNERRRNHAEAEEQRRELTDVPLPPPPEQPQPQAGLRPTLSRAGGR